MKETMSNRIVVVCALALAALIFYGSSWIKVPSRAQQIISIEKTSQTYVLEEGNTMEQRIILGRGSYAEVVVYAVPDRLRGRRLVMSILDEQGHVVARSDRVSVDYRSDDESMRLWFSFVPFRLSASEHLIVRLELREGLPLPVHVSDPSAADAYSSGELLIQGKKTQRDMAIDVVPQAPLSSGARQGVLAGLLLLVGVAGLQLATDIKKKWILLYVLISFVAPVAILGYWFSFDMLGISDWDYYFSLHHAYRETILTYRQLPLWNPWTCGGTASLADPEFPVFTPTFLLELAFGIPAGLRLAIFLSVIVGAWGMVSLAKRLHLSPEASLVAAIAVPLGTVNLLEVTEGHVNVFAAMWIPWVFFSWLTAYRHEKKKKEKRKKKTEAVRQHLVSVFLFHFSSSKGWRILLGAFLAITFLQGGIYLLMYTALAFLVLPFLVTRPLIAVKTSVIGGLWGFGFAAFKIFPVLLWLGQFPDETYASSAFTLPWIIHVLFERHIHGEYIIFGQNSGWHEYGAYVGYIVLALALIGMTKLKRHRVVRALLAASIASIVLSSVGPYLRPFFDTMWFFPRSNISRFILLAVIPMALLAGYGLDKLRSAFNHRGFKFTGTMVAVFLVGLVGIDILSLTYQISEQAFVLPDVIPLVQRAPYPIAFTPERFDEEGTEARTTRAWAAAREGWGTFAYCSVLGPAPMARTIYDEDHNVLLVRDKRGAYELTRWSPNEVSAHVVAQEPTEVIVNTNYAKGWRVNGNDAVNIDGRVGVKIGAGEHNLTFQYKTPGLLMGLLISGLAFGAAALPSVMKRDP